MASLKRSLKILQRKNSKSHVFFLVFILIIFFLAAITVRYYIFEPLQMENASMSPRHKENSFLWMCKLPQCIEKIKLNETVWAKLRSHENLVRKVIAMPGDSLFISDNGRVKSGKLRFKWKGESAFIESRSLYIPKKGDTLHFSKLNDIEQDNAITLLFEQGADFYVTTTLWQGDRELHIDRVGATKLGNRQVSLQEINVLPWQDRRLIEMQIRQAEPGNAAITLRRELHNASDSSLIENIVVEEDCYYLACERGHHCVDSRESGYFTKSRLLGRYVIFPDKIKNFFKSIAKKFITAK